MAAQDKTAKEQFEEAEEKETPKVQETEEERKDFWGGEPTVAQEVENTQEKVESEATEVVDEEPKKDPEPPTELHGISSAGPRGGNNTLWIVLTVVVLLAVLAGGFWFFNKSKDAQEEAEATPAPVVEATSTPEPVATEAVVLADYKIQILNGSGTPGEAAKVQEMLEEAGFEDFEVGNASSYTYKNTEISVKASGVPDEVFNTIKESLDEEYTTESVEPLDEDSEYDVVITIGSKKAS